MKDSQRAGGLSKPRVKYIKANNERFSTTFRYKTPHLLSISRRIMKDSQLCELVTNGTRKYIKANNERFSTLRNQLPPYR